MKPAHVDSKRRRLLYGITGGLARIFSRILTGRCQEPYARGTSRDTSRLSVRVSAALRRKVSFLLRIREVSTIADGKGCVPVGALVFKISGRRREVGCGGFDSHAFPSRAMQEHGCLAELLLERRLLLIDADFHGFFRKNRENPAPSDRICVPIKNGRPAVQENIERRRTRGNSSV